MIYLQEKDQRIPWLDNEKDAKMKGLLTDGHQNYKSNGELRCKS